MVDDVFAEAVRAAVSERADGEAVIIPVTKNNGLRLTALMVNRTRVGSGEDTAGAGKDKAGAGETGDAVKSIEPNFYLDNIPEDQRTEENVDEIANRIIRAINRSLEDGAADGIVERLQSLLADKEQLLNSLLPHVVNYEWNKEMLKTLPHRRYLDLAITYEIEIEGVGHASISTCRVRNGMMDLMELDEPELYKAAMRNARLRKYQVMPIWDLIERNMMRNGFRPKAVPFPGEAEMSEHEIETAAVDKLIPMFVITNENMDKGAYGIVDTELLKSISDGFEIVGGGGNREPGEHGESGEPGEHKAPDLIIIPSSVHEILAVQVRSKVDLDGNLDHIRRLVSEVNRTNVSLDERLSDSVYIFERETGEVRIA